MQPLAQAKETPSPHINELTTITHSKNPASEKNLEARQEEHSGPATENVAPLSYDVDSSADTSSLSVPPSNEPAPQEPPVSEAPEATSVAALSVDTQEQDDDSALGDTSI